MATNIEITEGRRAQFIEALLKGGTISSACKLIGITRPTYYSWRHRSESFRTEADKAILSQVTIVEEALYKTALKGNLGAQVFILCNRARDRWQHVAKIEHRFVAENIMQATPQLEGVSADDLRVLRDIAGRTQGNALPGVIDTNATIIQSIPTNGKNGTNGDGTSGPAGSDKEPSGD